MKLLNKTTDIVRVNTPDYCPPESEPPVRVQPVVSCVHCRHCGSHNGAQARCKYPRERQPEVMDMTTESGWTMAVAAAICSKYEAANIAA